MMNRDQETFKTWNKIAEIYEKMFMQLDLYDDTYRFFCEALKENQSKVLEIGCGPGNITKFLLQQRPDMDILGIDIAPKMIELAEKNNPSARFEVMDARKVNQLQESFHGIIAGFCLPYFSEKETETFIETSANLLSAKGVLYLSFVEGDADQSGFKGNKNADRVYFYYHKLKNIEERLLQQKFKISKVFYIDYPSRNTATETHTVLVAIKNNE
jgi:trans-aconitate methyltransferase